MSDEAPEQLVTSFTPDQVVAEWFLGVAVANPALVRGGEVLAFALHPWVFRVALVGAAVLAWRRGHPRRAVVALGAMALGSALGVGLKLLVARPRPVWADPVAAEIGYSMPSGHALNATLGSALLVVLAWPWLRRRGLTVPAVAAAATVAAVACLDRMLLGVHYLTDVLAGASIGTALALVAARLVRRAGPDGRVRHGSGSDGGRGVASA